MGRGRRKGNMWRWEGSKGESRKRRLKCPERGHEGKGKFSVKGKGGEGGGERCGGGREAKKNRKKKRMKSLERGSGGKGKLSVKGREGKDMEVGGKQKRKEKKGKSP